MGQSVRETRSAPAPSSRVAILSATRAPWVRSIPSQGEPMKNFSIATLGGLAATAALAAAALTGASASSAAAAAVCTPKAVTIKGAPGIALCGPATATLTVAGKSYSFRHGFCAELPGSSVFQLSLGVDVTALSGPNNNGDQPGFSLDIAQHPTIATVAFAYSGGRELVKADSVTIAGKFPQAGTFKGKTSSISGSWNCHGVLSKS
jgi:hypothetical protein